MSDVTISPGLDEPELFSPGGRPQRRFTRRAFVPPVVRRSAPEITEGKAQGAVNVREGLYRRTLAVADAFAAFVAIALVVVWDAGANLEPWVLLAMPVAVFVAKVGGLYERDELVLKKTTLDEAPALLQITGLFALIVFLGRVAARRVAASLSRPERCLILGDDAAVRTVRGKLEDGSLNAKVVGSVRLDALSPRIGAERFRSLVCDNDVHRVILAPVTTDARDTLELIRVAKSVGVRVSLLPRLFEVVGSSVEFDHVDGLTMLGVRRFGLTRSSHALKRAFDLFGSSLMLLALTPIMAAVAIAIRLDGRGPILFRQTRIGRDGAPFEIFKFRTMVPDAEARKQALAHLNETEGLFKIAADPRITRVGAVLRRTALDELPQLLNVWRGEMSLVGPRPLVVDEDAKIEGLDRSRLHLTPGMTGPWQVLGSTRVPMREMVVIDYLYAANWSLWSDMKILLRTIPYMLARRGA